MAAGNTDDADSIEGIEAFNDVALETIGIVAGFAVQPVAQKLIRFDRDQIRHAIPFGTVGVPAEIPMELIASGSSGQDVASIAPMNEVVAVTAVKDVPTGPAADHISATAA